MLQNEIAELIGSVNMYDIASKTIKEANLNENEQTVVSQLDQWAKKIGATGNDPDHEIAAFISRVINEEIYDAPENLLDYGFVRGSVGEFDAWEAGGIPKNTLVAYEAAKGANVPRSFVNLPAATPKFVNLQVETDLDYADLRRNGWKTVARLTDYAITTLKNKMIGAVMAGIDSALVSGDNVISESTAAPTATSADALALYLLDRGAGYIVGASKYIQAMSKLSGFASDNMKDEVNRTGYLGRYDGNALHAVSSVYKDGAAFILPDKRVFGFAGQAGAIDMRGEIHVYENMDNNNECVHLMVKDFSFVYAITNPENVAKIVMAQ